MPFQFQRLDIPDVILVRPRVFRDERGLFTEIYQASAYQAQGLTARFVQDNHSRSKYRALRGLHFQIPPAEQGKLVYVTRGEVFDVALDIRKGSPTYGTWVSQRLSDRNRHMLYVPGGFAHGFQVLSREGADVAYKVTAEYDPDLSRGIAWDDPTLKIPWPHGDPILSEQDRRWPALQDLPAYFSYEDQ